MPISLPPDLAERVQKKMNAAPYRSPDDVIRKALDALDATEGPAPLPPDERDKVHQSIWSRFQDAIRRIPQDELDTLPSDGASEHDHYIYGTPKRQV